jgi:hypothetical protein
MTEPRITGPGWHDALRSWSRGRRNGTGLATLVARAGSAARTVMRDLRSCPPGEF